MSYETKSILVIIISVVVIVICLIVNHICIDNIGQLLEEGGITIC